MDLQSFLQSGLIEAYVLGQCSAAERAEVEQMAARYPEVRAEIAAVEQALEQYAQSNAVPPPDWMKGRVLDLVGRETPAATTARPGGLQRYLSLGLAAASVALLAAVIGLWRLNEARNEQIAQLDRQARECLTRELAAQKLQEQVALLRDPQTKQLVLKDDLNTGLAYLNTASCQLAVDLSTLPAPRGATYYQFWAIVDGQPRNMGMIRREAGVDWQTFACVPGAAAYAISEENNPQGNATPTTVRLVGAVEG